MYLHIEEWEIMRTHHEWIDYKGQRILFFSYEGSKGDDYVEAIYANMAYIKELNQTELLVLINVKDSVADYKVIDAYKKTGLEIQAYSRKIAVFGLSGLHRYLMDIINSFTNAGAKPFHTKERALDWLVE